MFVKASMRLVFAVLSCIVPACAQQQKPGPSPEEEEIARLQGLADQVKAALANSDLATANRLATELGLAISRHERALQLAQVEEALSADGANRFYGLGRAAIAAYDASDYDKAEIYAKELLSLAPQYRGSSATEMRYFTETWCLDA